MMFKKVLIVEDHESASISVQKMLTDLDIEHDTRNYVYYCDDALSRIKKAIRDEEPYELMITDLSFMEDGPQVLKSGAELIEAVKQIQPDLKILVFSSENRTHVAQSLIKNLGIDAFVPKARHDAKDLKMALEVIFKNKIYVSPNLKKTVAEEDAYHFTEFEKTIITLLSKGTPQKNIPFYLQKNNITPNSLSSVEKHLNSIKTTLSISNNEQLIAYCKDKKII